MNPRLNLTLQYALVCTNLPTQSQFRKWAKAALRIDTEVTIRIVDKQEGYQLNHLHRGKAAPADAQTAALSAWDIPVTLDKAIHQPHLENFFDAIRHGTPLNCPGESAFATAVTILKINESIAAQKMLTFAPGDFTA